MKKKVFAAAVVVSCLAILAAGTLSYYTAEEQAHNIITTDAVEITIEEWQDQVGGTPYPDEPIRVMPNTTVSKLVTVRNHRAESYLRASFEIIVSNANGERVQITPEALAGIMTVAVNEDQWQRKPGDGNWWYYAGAVPAGAGTEPLFTEVVFDGPNMTNEYQNCTVEINVSAQAVQTAHNGDSALSAQGWPEG